VAYASSLRGVTTCGMTSSLGNVTYRLIAKPRIISSEIVWVDGLSLHRDSRCRQVIESRERRVSVKLVKEDGSRAGPVSGRNGTLCLAR
jgi:hypothetical protein